MRYAVLVFLCFSCTAGAQEQKHMMTVAANGEWPTTLTAFEIERFGQYPSAVHLKGAVEIKSPVCFRVGKSNELQCDGEMILRVDEATFHEDSGQIEARGAITVIPRRHAANARE
jgi:hypothetical protein